MRTIAVVLLAAGVLASAACNKKKTPAPYDTGSPTTPAGPVPTGSAGVPKGAISAKPFLEGTKTVPARREWNRDFGSKKGGVVVFRVSSPAPVAITIITDRGYKVLTSGNPAAMSKADVLLSVDGTPPSYEGRVTVPPGMSWFIIENRSDAEAQIRLECFPGS